MLLMWWCFSEFEFLISYGGDLVRPVGHYNKRQIHATIVCARTLATHVQSSLGHAVPCMAKP